MKILATFDGSACSESILPQLETFSALPGAEIILLRVGALPQDQLRTEVGSPVVVVAPGGAGGTAVVVNAEAPEYAETKEQAVERTNAELSEYLLALTHRLPAAVPCRVQAILDDHPRSAIVRFAMEERPDLIVMATHGETGLVHVLFGDTAESVVRAGIAPVMLVPPDAGHARP